MEDTCETTKKKRQKRNSERAVPPNVKHEVISDAGKEEVPRRRVEERVPRESDKRKAAVAASRQEAVVEKAARPGKATQSDPGDSDGDSYTPYSDYSVTPAGDEPFPSSGEHYEPSHRAWSEDERGRKAEGRPETTRRQRHRARSCSGGHGKGGKQRRRDASQIRVWKSDYRSDAFADRASDTYARASLQG